MATLWIGRVTILWKLTMMEREIKSNSTKRKSTLWKLMVSMSPQSTNLIEEIKEILIK